jgi:hypothetical protein
MASELKVDTVSEKTTGSGVTIDGVLIKDGQVDGVDVSTLSVDTNGLVKLGTHTFSNDADFDFDVLDEDTYVGYKIILKDMIAATDNGQIRVGLRAGGVDILTTNSYLRQSWYGDVTSSATGTFAASSRTGHFETAFNQGNATGEMSQSIIDIMPHGTQKQFSATFTYESNGGAQLHGHLVAILRNDTTVDGLRIFHSLGNITSGTADIWGYKK